MATPYKFQGWIGHNAEAAKGKMVWEEFEPKPFEENDIDIKITHCGICGTDLHTLNSVWGPSDYPLCVGHEIVGHVVRVGKHVSAFKIGDRVGVGGQSGACMNRRGDCEFCADGEPHFCPNLIQTYNGRWPDGSKTYGGFADYWRGSSDLVIKIPDAIPSDEAAPMLCAGITAFNPLQRANAGPKTRVGIIGVGGLGHFGIMGAKALGCKEIIAISRTSTKKEDAMKMGATGFIATAEEEDWANKHSMTLDLIVSTIAAPKMPLAEYLQLLRPKGKLVLLGAPGEDLPGFNAFSLLIKAGSIAGSLIGSPTDLQEMLRLFAEKGVHTWNNNIPMTEANQALIDFEAGKPRYRYVLVNEKNLQ